MKYTVAFLILNGIHLPNAIGQSPYFIQYYGSQETNDQARAILQFMDGAIYLSGFSNISGSSDPALLKVNQYGDSLWMKTYGDAAFDVALSINHCGDSEIILTGERVNDLTGTDIIVLKIDSGGNLLWETEIKTEKNESGKFIEQTQDGGFIVCGFQSDDFGYNDIFVAKLDSFGTVVWMNHYGGEDNEYANQVHELSDGSFIVTADTKSKGEGGYDVELIKLTSGGSVIWDYTYGDEFENGCQGICIASNGDLISYGETETYQFSPFDFFIERISPDGLSIWKEVFGGNGSDAAFSLIEDQSGNLILTGYSNSYNGGDAIDVVVVKTDAGGSLMWVYNYGNAGIDIGYGIIETENGFLVGATSFVDGSNDFFLLSLSKEGLLSTSHHPFNDLNQFIEMTVFPNPTGGEITIEFAETITDLQLKMIDMTGRLVIKFDNPGQTRATIIKIEGGPGIYWLSAKSPSGNWWLPVEKY